MFNLWILMFLSWALCHNWCNIKFQAHLEDFYHKMINVDITLILHYPYLNELSESDHTSLHSRNIAIALQFIYTLSVFMEVWYVWCRWYMYYYSGVKVTILVNYLKYLPHPCEKNRESHESTLVYCHVLSPVVNISCSPHTTYYFKGSDHTYNQR